MRSLDGRCAIVTGAGHGLGRAYAQRLADAGANVAIVDLDERAAAGVADGLREQGKAAEAFQADVSDAPMVASITAAILDRFGRADVLVNNAGGALYPTTPFDELDEEQWDRIVDTNLKGQWLFSRAVAPAMRARQSGSIINISSTVVWHGRPEGLSAYAAAKAGVIGLTRALAKELGRHTIRVNAVCPGFIPVPTVKNVHSTEAAQRLREQMIAEQCLKRSGTPEDLADVIVFLASDAASFITGQAIHVDGGWAMR